MKKAVFLFVVLVLSCCFLQAQDVAYAGEPYDSYAVAMNLAHGGQHQAARDTLERVLDRFPQNYDLASLLAKTYSWDGDYNEARKQLNRITSKERKHKESWVAAIQNERYADNLHIALGLANKALAYLPDDEEIRALQAKILEEIRLSQSPGESPVKEGGKDDTEARDYRNQMGLINSVDVFDIVYDPMVHSGIEYIRETRLGQIIPRVNYSNRFRVSGLQYELDLYPKLSERFYAYLNYGYSEADIFPNHRVGAELHADIPGGFEASLGMRYLQFLAGEAQLYTASLAYYTGNYYMSARPFINPRPDGSVGFSGLLQARKYFRDTDNFLSAQLSFGFSPELRQLRANGSLLAETLLYIESQQVLLEYQFTPGQKPFIYRALLGLTRQEFAGNAGSYFWALTAGLRYHVRF